MPRLHLRLAAGIALFAAVLCVGPPAAEAAGNRLFFLHHSTGRYMLAEGEGRAYLAQVNTAKSTSYRLWDHDYNYIGLTDAAGTLLGRHFGIPYDDTDPFGLHQLWCTDNAARDSILSRFDVIAFKSCYTGSDIGSDAELQQNKTWYLEIRDELDRHPDKTFLIISQPPRHRLATDADDAARARAFADWLGSAEFLSGHPNLRFFDLFDRLATPDDGSAEANTLRWEYELSHSQDNSHPNTLANETLAPVLIDALVAAGAGGEVAAVEAPRLLTLLGNRPNPFNPSTSIGFVLDRGADVRVEVYDLRGRRVRTLADGPLAAGAHDVRWDGRDDAGRAAVSGVYLYRVHAGATILNGRMVLAK